MKQDLKPTTVAVRAIDVGYSNTKFTIGRAMVDGANKIQVALFPSLAPEAAKESGGKDVGESADVCLVTVGDHTYAVGPNSYLHAGVLEPRTIDPNYCATDKYKALMLGAMHYMAEAERAGHEFVIETLVVGLPLTTYHQFAAALTEWVPGEHLVGDHAGAVQRRITVNEVLVKVQPYGGLINFGVSSATKGERTLDGRVLVIDTGGGTLDWCMSDKRKVNWKLSGAYPKAMLACAYAVCDEIDKDWRNRPDIVEVIEMALRKNAPTFQVGTREYSLEKYRGKVDNILDEAVKVMLACTGKLDNVKRVLLTGGGAPVMLQYLKRKYPDFEQALEMDEDAVYSNVRGFQVLGEVAQLNKAKN